ncbi:MAG: helix-turn-helix domain-containing protein [Coprobacillus sp.]|nr:helix-turn-helix domain-containing protein [Coprobacillus sp.]
MEFKYKLIYARAKLNMSQTDLAKALGVSFQTINRWENGKVTPTKKAEIQFDEFCQEHKVVFKESASSEK